MTTSTEKWCSAGDSVSLLADEVSRAGLSAAAPLTHWTDIAHALGYHDQMHMVRDFKHLSGDSPTAIYGQLDMFVQPELISADDRKLVVKAAVNDLIFSASAGVAGL